MSGMAVGFRFIQQYEQPEDGPIADVDLALLLVAKVGGTMADALAFLADRRAVAIKETVRP